MRPVESFNVLDLVAPALRLDTEQLPHCAKRICLRCLSIKTAYLRLGYMNKLKFEVGQCRENEIMAHTINQNNGVDVRYNLNNHILHAATYFPGCAAAVGLGVWRVYFYSL